MLRAVWASRRRRRGSHRRRRLRLQRTGKAIRGWGVATARSRVALAVHRKVAAVARAPSGLLRLLLMVVGSRRKVERATSTRWGAPWPTRRRYTGMHRRRTAALRSNHSGGSPQAWAASRQASAVRRKPSGVNRRRMVASQPASVASHRRTAVSPRLMAVRRRASAASHPRMVHLRKGSRRSVALLRRGRTTPTRTARARADTARLPRDRVDNRQVLAAGTGLLRSNPTARHPRRRATELLSRVLALLNRGMTPTRTRAPCRHRHSLVMPLSSTVSRMASRVRGKPP